MSDRKGANVSVRPVGSADRQSSASEGGSQTHRIAVIPGDGIGVEVTKEAVRVLMAVKPALEQPVELTHFDWGAERWLKDKTTLPVGGMEDLRDH